ncbi:MAG: hypothetical protein J6Y02_24215 [Pseudobutyrivibrio sp.]|nr:hypothetical protein [Pseudobutyrivibrio sp.]
MALYINREGTVQDIADESPYRGLTSLKRSSRSDFSEQINTLSNTHAKPIQLVLALTLFKGNDSSLIPPGLHHIGIAVPNNSPIIIPIIGNSLMKINSITFSDDSKTVSAQFDVGANWTYSAITLLSMS